MPDQQPADRRADPTVERGPERAISQATVKIMAEYIGRGARTAHTVIADGLAVVLLTDSMLKAELSLAQNGRSDLVLAQRHAFQETMETDLIEAVERILGRKVLAFMSANHLQPDYAAEIFVLGEPIKTR